MTTVDEIDMHEVVEQLRRSERGRQAMRIVLEWMDIGGIGLDHQNQTAILRLIALMWRFPGSARDYVRETLEA